MKTKPGEGKELAMAERWQDLVNAHLMALGVTPAVALSGWNFHLLLVPTFHPSGWLSFHEVRATLEFEMVVLQERFAPTGETPLLGGSDPGTSISWGCAPFFLRNHRYSSHGRCRIGRARWSLVAMLL
jgi:hypothetical protein